ncbi:hypothetical protein H0H81_011552 [Sphagnurus paluster]|uniref:Rab-GAP TBC domain-containing protein n=1 Tax=Sphagnurus paluster TaxID=117069 RepID=A0A9P7GHB6_9AGAR|nr:hypothetical protein H0H81_011552 [Sphagnurus paluster]
MAKRSSVSQSRVPSAQTPSESPAPSVRRTRVSIDEQGTVLTELELGGMRAGGSRLSGGSRRGSSTHEKMYAELAPSPPKTPLHRSSSSYGLQTPSPMAAAVSPAPSSQSTRLSLETVVKSQDNLEKTSISEDRPLISPWLTLADEERKPAQETSPPLQERTSSIPLEAATNSLPSPPPPVSSSPHTENYALKSPPPSTSPKTLDPPPSLSRATSNASLWIPSSLKPSSLLRSTSFAEQHAAYQQPGTTPPMASAALPSPTEQHQPGGLVSPWPEPEPASVPPAPPEQMSPPESVTPLPSPHNTWNPISRKTSLVVQNARPPEQTPKPSSPSHHSTPSQSTTATLVNDTPPPTLPAPLPDPRASLASSRRTSVLSSYSQSTFHEDDDYGPPTPTSPEIPLPTASSTATAPDVTPAPVPAPDASTSYADSSRISLALSDGGVGIGLSLLQDLAGGGSQDGWSDSDSGSDADGQLMGHATYSTRRTAGGGGGGEWGESMRGSMMSEASKYSDDDSDDGDGLGYEDTELGHGPGGGDTQQALEADLTQTQEAYTNLDGPLASSAASSQRTSLAHASSSSPPMTFPPIAPLSPSRTRSALSLLQQTTIQGPAKGEDYEYEFPPPPTHTPRIVSRLSQQQQQKPSPPPTGTVDDPNQPRSPLSPRSPRSPGADSHTEAEAVARTARRPSLAPSAVSSDWDGAAEIYDDYRYSRFSVSSHARSFASSTSKRMSVASSKYGGGGGIGGGGEWPPPFVDDPEARSRADSSSRPSVDSARGGEAEAQTHTRARSGTTGHRPAPLTLVTSNLAVDEQRGLPGRSPLLHTAWVSPLPSPGAQSVPVSAGGIPSGMASAIRERFELQRQASQVQREVDVGEEEEERGIVVEDDDCDGDEVVIGHRSSRRDSENSDEERQSTLHDHEEPSLSSSPDPEPDLVAKGRLAPLVIANRTPSPAGDDDGAVEKKKDMEAPVKAEEPPVETLPTPVSSPPLPPPTLRPTAPSSSPVPSQLRPSLLELRGQDQGQRQSLFLPHPNAPKAPPALSPGPMYIAQQEPPPQPPLPPTRGGALQTLRMALAMPPGPRGRGPTIYGVPTEDLSAATGPVLMHFSLTPPPATAPPPGSVPPPTVPMPSLNLVSPQPIVAPVPVLGVRRVGSLASLDAAAAAMASDDESSSSGVIPRANFFPKAAGVRPRSRSFSGFQTTAPEIPIPIQRSREEGSQPVEMPSANEVKRALSPITASPTTPLSSSPTPKNAPPKPSPLRISSAVANNTSGIRGSKPPNSPLAQYSTTLSASVPSSPTVAARPIQQLKQMASRSTLNEVVTAPRQTPTPRTILPSSNTSEAGSSPSQSSPLNNIDPPRPSIDSDATSIRSARSNLISPQPFGRHNSLRSKLSLPNLRRNLSRQDDPPNNTPESPTVDGDTLQVKDMDFELVRPNIAQFQAARTSQDSGVMGRDGSVDARQDTKFLRPDSPAGSLAPPRSPTVASSDHSPAASSVWAATQPKPSPSPQPSPLPQQGRPLESESSMDAHRQRELKWMSVINSVAPAQARKSKKVKKLLFDGVPSSVRYLVWSHLTDGKARVVHGVYTQLMCRGRVPALAGVEKDVQRCFADQPQLQSTQGPVVSLLQAYFSMVPDVQYTTGLTLIAGTLLLIAPEEDAFWIFVSVMDTHIRSYFWTTPTQLDVDASLFSRALENNDPQLAKRLLTDFAISPSTICRPWFTSLFVGSLPSDYLNRVWDVFLFEGVPFLLRVALALVSCCRRQIAESTSAESALKALHRPSSALLPASPEALVTLALSVKLKDDDIRKQRVKLEAQVKRQTQAPRTISGPGAISLPRT